MTRLELINYIALHAIEARKKTGVSLFPSVTIAQFIIESGWKLSNLARKYNNFFGIKADKSWKGEKVLLRTAEYDKQGNKYFIDDYFRVYSSPVDSFIDRVNFLTKFKRYSKVLAAKDPFIQADELQRAGYATAPDYADKLKKLIRQYNLTRFDVLPPSNNIAPVLLASFFVVAGMVLFINLK